MKFYPRHRKALIVLVAGLLALVAACSGGTDNGAADGDRQSVVLLTVTEECEYCGTVQRLVQEQLEDQDIDVDVKITNYDAAEQAQQVNQAISQNPDAILLWPADATAAVAPIRQINSAGIPVVVFNSEPQSEDAEAAWFQFTGPDDTLMGSQAAVAMVEGIEEKGQPLEGQVAVITGIPGTTPAVKRLDGFTEKLAELAPDLEVSTVVAASSWDQAGSADVAASILSRIPTGELRGVFGQYDPFIAAFIVAAQQADLDPSEFVTVGVVCTPEGRRHIESGDQYASILQSPQDEASYAVAAVTAALAGDEPDDKRNYLPAEVITQSNVDQCTS